MKFRNPINGHVEERHWCFLWALLFGGFYFIVNGLFAPLLVWLIIEVNLGLFSFFIQSDLVYLLIGVAIHFVFALMAKSMLRASFLRKGWIEMTDPAEGEDGVRMPSLYRPCPFCAEDIRSEASKCRHCQSDVDPLVEANVMPQRKSVAPRPLPDKQILVREEGSSIGEWRERVMAAYGVKEQGGCYMFRGQRYASLDQLIAALQALYLSPVATRNP